MTKFIEFIDAHFNRIHVDSSNLVSLIPEDRLFWKPPAFDSHSCGEYLLRSAAAVEQTFGGISARLWDDPFEWTLPEELSTKSKILEYLAEVETTRKKGIGYFTSDADLVREIPAPEQLTPIFEVLLQAISRASHYQGRAFAIFKLFSSADLPLV